VWQLQGDPESFSWGLNDVTDGMPPKERHNLEENVLACFSENPEPVTLTEQSAKTGPLLLCLGVGTDLLHTVGWRPISILHSRLESVRIA